MISKRGVLILLCLLVLPLAMAQVQEVYCPQENGSKVYPCGADASDFDACVCRNGPECCEVSCNPDMCNIDYNVGDCSIVAVLCEQNVDAGLDDGDDPRDTGPVEELGASGLQCMVNAPAVVIKDDPLIAFVSIHNTGELDLEPRDSWHWYTDARSAFVRSNPREGAHTKLGVIEYLPKRPLKTLPAGFVDLITITFNATDTGAVTNTFTANYHEPLRGEDLTATCNAVTEVVTDDPPSFGELNKTLLDPRVYHFGEEVPFEIRARGFGTLIIDDVFRDADFQFINSDPPPYLVSRSNNRTTLTYILQPESEGAGIAEHIIRLNLKALGDGVVNNTARIRATQFEDSASVELAPKSLRCMIHSSQYALSGQSIFSNVQVINDLDEDLMPVDAAYGFDEDRMTFVQSDPQHQGRSTNVVSYRPPVGLKPLASGQQQWIRLEFKPRILGKIPTRFVGNYRDSSGQGYRAECTSIIDVQEQEPQVGGGGIVVGQPGSRNVSGNVTFGTPGQGPGINLQNGGIANLWCQKNLLSPAAAFLVNATVPYQVIIRNTGTVPLTAQPSIDRFINPGLLSINRTLPLAIPAPPNIIYLPPQPLFALKPVLAPGDQQVLFIDFNAGPATGWAANSFFATYSYQGMPRVGQGPGGGQQPGGAGPAVGPGPVIGGSIASITGAQVVGDTPVPQNPPKPGVQQGPNGGRITRQCDGPPVLIWKKPKPEQVLLNKTVENHTVFYTGEEVDFNITLILVPKSNQETFEGPVRVVDRFCDDEFEFVRSFPPAVGVSDPLPNTNCPSGLERWVEFGVFMSQGRPPYINLTLRVKTDHPAVNHVEIPATLFRDSAWVNITAPLYLGPFPAHIAALLNISPTHRIPVTTFGTIANVTAVTPVALPPPSLPVPTGSTNVVIPPWNGSVTVTNNSVIISANQSGTAPTTVICSRQVVDMLIRARDLNGLASLIASCPALANSLSGVIPATVQTTTQNVANAVRKSRSGHRKITQGSSVGQVVQGVVQVADAATDTALLVPRAARDIVRNLYSLINPVDINSLAMSCTDNILNQGEEDVDCGGPCKKCAQLEGPALITEGLWTALFIGFAALLVVLVTYLVVVQRNRRNTL